MKPGDEVCVIGHSFVERARTLVNIQATASEEIRDYHELVAERFAAIPEPSIQAKLRTLVTRMGDQSVTTERARYWIDLADELEKPLYDVVPHAPSDRETFMRFTKALEIGEGMASNFWRWAVVAQRSHRLRYGNVFHDAFRGILTDPHAAVASNRDRTDQIRLLRSMAEEHVAVVDSVRSFTTDAFQHIAGLARERFAIMIPYIDRIGAAWAAGLFESTTATERVLVLRNATQLLACGAEGRRVEDRATRIINYGGADGTAETFHAKIVLADGVAAYVGSANLLRRSKATNLECGMLVEGPAVAAVKVLLDAVTSLAKG